MRMGHVTKRSQIVVIFRLILVNRTFLTKFVLEHSKRTVCHSVHSDHLLRRLIYSHLAVLLTIAFTNISFKMMI